MEKTPAITPDMKVYTFLETYPHLENDLMALAPAFKNLKNPVLRKTIARITSLGQAAVIGGMGIDQMINTLRAKAGQEHMDILSGRDPSIPGQPEWFDACRLSISVDARPMLKSGGHPLQQVFREASTLQEGEMLELITPFLPIPLIEKMKERGFRSWSKDEEGIFYNYFTRQQNNLI